MVRSCQSGVWSFVGQLWRGLTDREFSTNQSEIPASLKQPELFHYSFPGSLWCNIKKNISASLRSPWAESAAAGMWTDLNHLCLHDAHRLLQSHQWNIYTVTFIHKVMTFRQNQPRPHKPDVTKRFGRVLVLTGIDSLLHVCDPDEHKTNSLIHANDFRCNHLHVWMRKRGSKTNQVSSASH